MNDRRTCIGEPVSWLRLERYKAGELDAKLAGEIAKHLEACPVCAECMRQIEADEATPLPSLELPERKAPAKESTGKVIPFARARGRFGVILGGLAVAAAAMLGVGRGGFLGTNTVDRPSSPRVKGGDVVFSLVRDDGVRIDDSAGVFRDGDRFKVVVTCPPTLHASFDVVVFDDGGASFPLALVPSLACGNEIPVPGAFRLTGSTEETVCVVWNVASGAEARVTPRTEADLGRDARCKRLRSVARP